MVKDTLFSLFDNACDKFADNKCITFVHETYQISLNYVELKYLIENFCNVWESNNINTNCRFIGVVGNQLCIEIVAIIIGIMKMNCGFFFFDTFSVSKMYSDVRQKLNIVYFICESNNLLGIFLEHFNLTFNFITSFKLLKRNFEIWNYQSEEYINLNEHLLNFAYAVLSSGSTGVAKIIKVPHESIVPNVLDLRKIYKMQSNDTVYIPTPLTFDPCILDIFLSFSSGSSILLLDNQIKFNSHYISKIFSSNEFNVTVLYITPSLFLKWFPQQFEYLSLRILILGGEPFPNLNYDTWPFLRTLQVYNIYGITEVSCWAALYCVENLSEEIHLGISLTDTILEIRNENGEIIQEGIGELFIGSNNRKCIINNEDDVSKFDCCFRETGDLVNIKSGKLYYVGRKNRQIKLYGHQIDLSIIEAKIFKHQSVKLCFSFFIEDEFRIVTFVESRNSELTANELITFLKTDSSIRLIPDFYIVSIPLNKHDVNFAGKICEISCTDLYFNLKCNANKNIYTEFPNLWKKYTSGELSVDINNSKGFMQSGGNSIQALQFSSDLSDICTVPKDFVSSLLSDKSFTYCFKLVKSISNSNDKNDYVFVSKNIKTDTLQMKEKIFDYDANKRKKLMSNSVIIQLKFKGKITNLKEHRIFDENIMGMNEMTMKWKHDLGKCVDASPVIFVFEDQEAVVVCGSHSGYVFVVNAETGKIISKILLPDRVESSACISPTGEHIFIGCYDKKLYSIIIKDNRIDWYFQSNDMIKSTPVFHNNQIFFGSYDYFLYCLSSDSGFLLWKICIDNSSIYATPIVNQNSIIVATLGGTIAFLKSGGIIKHKNYSGKPFFCNPCELPNKNLCVAIDVEGVIRLYDLNTGYQVWQYSVGGNVFSSITVARVMNTKIIFGCHDKNIYCFEIFENTGSLVWKKEVDAAVYSTPFSFKNLGILESYIFDEHHYAVVATVAGTIYIMNVFNGDVIVTYKNAAAIFSSPIFHNSSIFVGSRDNYLHCFKLL